jgi:hypothetical protein
VSRSAHDPGSNVEGPADSGCGSIAVRAPVAALSADEDVAADVNDETDAGLLPGNLPGGRPGPDHAIALEGDRS